MDKQKEEEITLKFEQRKADADVKMADAKIAAAQKAKDLITSIMEKQLAKHDANLATATALKVSAEAKQTEITAKLSAIPQEVKDTPVNLEGKSETKVATPK